MEIGYPVGGIVPSLSSPGNLSHPSESRQAGSGKERNNVLQLSASPAPHNEVIRNDAR